MSLRSDLKIFLVLKKLFLRGGKTAKKKIKKFQTNPFFILFKLYFYYNAYNAYSF